MFHHRLLWGFVSVLTLVVVGPALAEKVKKKTPPPDANSRVAELVKIGLQAELAGDGESRHLHLQAALDLEPECAPAHWHLGQIRHGEEWLPVAKASVAINKSPQYSWYRSKRMELDGSVKKELALARWCEKEGMHDRAQFHFSRLLFNEGVDEKTTIEAMKKLDLTVVGGQFRTRSEVAEMQRDEAANTAAWNKWEKKLVEWSKAMGSGKEARRKHAHEQMQAIDDCHITPLVESQLATADEAWSLELVALLAKFPQPPATAALARCSVLSPHQATRDAAISQLKKRKLHDYVPLLLAGLSPITRTKFLVTIGDDLSVTYQHEATYETTTGKLTAELREDSPTIPVPQPAIATKPGISSPLGNLQAAAIREEERAKAIGRAEAALTQARLMEQRVALQNAVRESHNARFFSALEKTTGQAIPPEPVKWWNWWQQYNEVAYEKPSFHFIAQYSSPVYRQVPISVSCSCFVAGTPVFTESGPQRIESIRPGDRVLSQDPNTGELAFKLVQNVTVRPPSKLRKITLEGSEIVTTLGHPFWVNGTGWKMAKELELRQNLHTLQGAAIIVSVDELPLSDQAYNLVVADYNTYFVGSANVLVHDNLYRQPTLAKVPGLIEVRK